MEVLEWHSVSDTLGPLFDCKDGYFHFRNMFFSSGGANDDIVHQFIYGIFKLHIYEESLYYHATSGIYFHIPFKRFT